MKNTVTVVDDLFSVDRDILKISAFVHNGRAAKLVPAFTERWGDRISVALSGAEWIDFTIANKGTAIRVLQERSALRAMKSWRLATTSTTAKCLRRSAIHMSWKTPRLMSARFARITAAASRTCWRRFSGLFKKSLGKNFSRLRRKQ